MRAAAIVLVLLTHYTAEEPLFRIVGPYGVILFFLISGFLIARLMLFELRSGSIGLAGFYWRRIRRLLPAVLVFCAIMATVEAVQAKLDARALASVMFYFANYEVAARSTDGIASYYQVFWSLAVEEHFYIVFPLAVALLRRPGSIAVFAATVFVLVVGWKVYSVLHWPEIVGSDGLYVRTEYRIDAIALGVFLAAACEVRGMQGLLRTCVRPAMHWGSPVVLGVVYLAIDPQVRSGLTYTLAVLAMAPMFVAILFSSSRVQPVLNSALLVWLGKRSYSLYIWHMPALIWFGPAVGLAAALVLAAVSYRYIERPWRRPGQSTVPYPLTGLSPGPAWR